MVLRSVTRWLQRNGVAPYGSLGDPKGAAAYMFSESVSSSAASLVFLALSALHVGEGRGWYAGSLLLSAIFTVTFVRASVGWGERARRFVALEARHRGEVMAFAAEPIARVGAPVEHAIPLRSALLVVLAIACTSQLGAAVHTHRAGLGLQIVSLLVAAGSLLLSIAWCVRQWSAIGAARNTPAVLVSFEASAEQRGQFVLRLDGLADRATDVRNVSLCDDAGEVLATCDVREQRVDAGGVRTLSIDVLRSQAAKLELRVAPTVLSLMIAPGVSVHVRWPEGFDVRT